MFVRIIFSLVLSFSSACAIAQAAKPLTLADDAPDRHVVVKGDTLWDISGKFLKEPWRWPEIWRLNRDQIRNPHLIYPGQVVVLDRSGATPRLSLGQPGKLEPQIYSESSAIAIPSIPHKAIDPYLSEPLVMEAEGLANAPKIIATQEDRVMVGPGNKAYVTGINERALQWQVFRPLKPIVDPENDQILGYEAFFLGNARVVREGEPATVEIVSAKQEIATGDRLIPVSKPEVTNHLRASCAGTPCRRTPRRHLLRCECGRDRARLHRDHQPRQARQYRSRPCSGHLPPRPGGDLWPA